MILSFADKSTAALFTGSFVRNLPPEIQERARWRLRQMDAAKRIEDLRLPSSNALEPLRENRNGQWSIRINKKWRICFRFENDNAWDVEVVDYH
ncbi:MAG: type II toxin-antitoxin system RelE/ParE family toxin [Leptospirillum sp.]